MMLDWTEKHGSWHSKNWRKLNGPMTSKNELGQLEFRKEIKEGD